MLPYNQTLIIIPTYNEVDNVGRMIDTLFDLYPDISLMIIEDGSPDGTAAVVREKQKNQPNLHMIERSGKLGLGTAYIEGFKWALQRDYQFFIQMDCDFSHDPESVKDLLEAAQDNDLVIGSRYIGGIRIINWPLRRLLLSNMASLYVRMITGIPVHDATTGFKCFRRKALKALDLDKIKSKGYIFLFEMTYRAWQKGFRIKEVPIILYERRDGQSKMGKGIIFEAVFSVIRLRILKMLGKL